MNDLAPFEEKLSRMAVDSADLQNAIVEIDTDLRAMYKAAEERGDSATMTAATTMWSRADQMVSMVGQRDEVIVGLMAMANELRNQRDNGFAELEHIERSVNDVINGSIHVAGNDLANRHNAVNALVSHVYQDAVINSYEEIWAELHGNLAEIMGWTQAEADRFYEAISYDPYMETLDADTPTEEADEILMDERGFTLTGLLDFRAKLRVMVAELYDDLEPLTKRLELEHQAANQEATYGSR